MDRRRFLGVVGAAAVAGCTGGGGGGGSGDYEEWIQGANSYEEEVDRTGTDQTTVMVGAGPANFSFDPPAIRVSTGTTVRWEWTGSGGGHNVVHVGGNAFSSDLKNQEGATFTHRFSSAGAYRYECEPHAAQGMKGGVRVVE